MKSLFFALSAPGWGELLLVLLIVLLFFGASKLPELSRSLGQAIKEFKKASKDKSEERRDDQKNNH